MRDATKDPRLIQGTATLAVVTAEHRVAMTFRTEGLQTVNFNLEGRWYEIRRNSYPSEDAFTIYEIIYIHGSAERGGSIESSS